MRIIAIDPGTSNTGLVYMDEHRVLCCKTVHGKPCGQDQYALMARASEIAYIIQEWMADKPHDAVVIEGFVSFSGTRQNSNTYQTPYLIGYLHSSLEEENIVIQTSNRVLNPRIRNSLARIKDLATSGYVVFPESEKCKNEHLRSALCHGLFYLREQGLWKDTK